eukprot:gene6398-biopygen13503
MVALARRLQRQLARRLQRQRRPRLQRQCRPRRAAGGPAADRRGAAAHQVPQHHAQPQLLAHGHQPQLVPPLDGEVARRGIAQRVGGIAALNTLIKHRDEVAEGGVRRALVRGVPQLRRVAGRLLLRAAGSARRGALPHAPVAREGGGRRGDNSGCEDTRPLESNGFGARESRNLVQRKVVYASSSSGGKAGGMAAKRGRMAAWQHGGKALRQGGTQAAADTP